MPTPAEILKHPFPALRLHPGSQLSFPWAEYLPDPVVGSSSHTFGPDGATAVMRMLIYWDHLRDALQELLGYSYRDSTTLTSKGTPYLRRKLPWQHPIWNQLYVKRISEVRGLRHQGALRRDMMFAGGTSEMRTGGYSGPRAQPNIGPWTDYYLAELVIHFWRPPYYVRSDAAVKQGATDPREWLRYVSKNWEMSLNMVSREGSTFQWLPGAKPPGSPAYFTGGVGQATCHFRVSRTWYQIPERALFNTIAGGLPEGLPENVVYTRTAVENPLSKYDRALGSTLTTFTTQTIRSGTTTNTVVQTSTIATTRPSLSAIRGALGYVYPSGSPIGGCVNAPIGGGFAADADGNWVDLTSASRFFGCYTGTLRFDGVTFTPQPLQLPPELMQIPNISAVEALSQQQYDVTFHFDLFDPPPGGNPPYGTPIKGHNLFPFSGNGLWYPLLTQKDLNNSTSGVKLTPFQYADFTDMFYIL